jgi:hypothetical protein
MPKMYSYLFAVLMCRVTSAETINLSGDGGLKFQRGYELFDDLVHALHIRNESVFGPKFRDENGKLIPRVIQVTSDVQVNLCKGDEASEVYAYPSGTTWLGWNYPAYAYNYNLDTSSEVLDSYCLFFQARLGDYNVNFDPIEGHVSTYRIELLPLSYFSSLLKL